MLFLIFIFNYLFNFFIVMMSVIVLFAFAMLFWLWVVLECILYPLLFYPFYYNVFYPNYPISLLNLQNLLQFAISQYQSLHKSLVKLVEFWKPQLYHLYLSFFLKGTSLSQVKYSVIFIYFHYATQGDYLEKLTLKVFIMIELLITSC